MFSPDVARINVSVVTRGNIRLRVKLSDACPFLPDIARYYDFAQRLTVFSVSAVTRGNVRVRVKLSGVCPFCPTSPVSMFSPIA
jgi:hypothetical protein